MTVVPATANQALLPATTETSAWYAVSAIINGRNTMVHPIADATSRLGDQPSVSVELSTYASCGGDVGATVRFRDLFYDLTSYSATLDGAQLVPAGPSAFATYRDGPSRNYQGGTDPP